MCLLEFLKVAEGESDVHVRNTTDHIGQRAAAKQIISTVAIRSTGTLRKLDKIDRGLKILGLPLMTHK